MKEIKRNRAKVIAAQPPLVHEILLYDHWLKEKLRPPGWNLARALGRAVAWAWSKAIWISWSLYGAELVREVGPGIQPLRRHEWDRRADPRVALQGWLR